MSTLSTYKTHLNDTLGTSSTNYYDEDKRERAINYALLKFVQDYKPLELRKKASISITQDADDYYTGTIPSDLSTPNRVNRLWIKASEREFFYVSPEEYYQSSDDVFTFDYSVAAAGDRLFVNSGAAVTLECHYYEDPATLSDDADESGLSSESDVLIAVMAAKKLFGDAHDTEGLTRLEVIERDQVPSWANQYNTRGKRLRSRFERTGYHSRP